MTVCTITKENQKLTGCISLPASKSISNRLLIILALSDNGIRLENLSTAEDTLLLQKLLQQTQAVQQLPVSPHSLDTRNAGTVMRFLTAYLSTRPGTWLLHGSERMHKRPVSILVEALRIMGATIDYAGTPGYPPLRITGGSLKGGEVKVDVSVSSQFVSALLMIAPCLPQGLTIRMIGEQVSFPYVEMTIRLMEEFGAVVERQADSLVVKPGNYRPETIPSGGYKVEEDWSAASFWYEAAALVSQAEIRLSGLHRNSLQGDAVVAKIFRQLGVETVYEEEGVLLTKHEAQGTRHKSAVGNWQPENTIPHASLLIPHSPSSFVPRPSSFDLSAHPDLAPPLIVTCSALGIPALFSGLHHLQIKESDRLQALETELMRLKRPVRHPASGIFETLQTDPLSPLPSDASPVTIETYSDHRMAMAFAPLALKTGTIRIANPSVVSKSYPGFWEEMKRAGFEIRGT
ncbi:MAG: 3-phosphoshikimate 1-carboxyvinyltransferase [Bacteroidota bacterium]